MNVRAIGENKPEMPETVKNAVEKWAETHNKTLPVWLVWDYCESAYYMFHDSAYYKVSLDGNIS